MADVIQFSSSPYPGLRPFRYDESDIFFGRERQTDQLLARLAHNRFLAVIGPSGCGKSSLVKAGMLPALRAGFMAGVGSRWRICELRPGDRPLGRLARALASPDILGAGRDSEESAAFVEATLRRGPLGLIEIVKGAEALQNAALLVVADQFEEVFRYRERIAVEEADAFVALLLASSGQREAPIYVVITMRSDYLGECAVFQGLPEAVSDSQYLTPRLTREELELAIAGPARVFGGRVNPKLVNRLINDFGTDPDQLPLLQHALARLWSRCSASAAPPLLTVKDYEAIGGLGAALSNHGDEVLAELTPERQRIAEILFRRLSGSENGRRDVRAPARVEEVAKIAAAEVSEVIAVAEVFRRPDRGFLAAPEGPLRADTMLDVSHESLIRQWQRLAGWVAAEANSEEMYRRLCDWALRWEQGNAELWRGPDLASALAWRQKEKPSPEWAERYGGGDRLHRAMKFLDASEEAQRVAAAAAEARRQAQLRRTRRLAWGFGAATVSLAAAILLYLVAYRWDFNAYYEEYVEVWGVPRGIGPLTAAEVGHHAASYKITKRGRLGPITSMQLVNAAGQPRHLKGTLFGRSSDEITKTVSRWEYLYDAQGQIAYETSLDRDGQRLQSIIYSPPEPEPIRSRTAYAIAKGGSLAPQKGSCAAFLTYDYSPEGYIERVHYLDQAGNPTPGKDDAFIKQSKYDRQGRVIESTSLWKDGRPMNDNGGNAGTRSSYDDSGNLVAFEYVDAAGKPIDLKKYGLQRFACKYDDRGNCMEVAAWHADGSPVLMGGSCHTKQQSFDNRANLVKVGCLRSDGQPIQSGEVKYNHDDQPIEEKNFDRAGRPFPGLDYGAFHMTLTHDAEGNVTETAFFNENGKPTLGNLGGLGFHHRRISQFESGREVRTEYRDGDGNLVAIDGGYAAIAKEYDTQGNEIRTTYLGVDDRPVPNRTEGYAIRKMSFDACGRATENRFFDADEHPLRSKKGYAHIRQTYDEYNNVKEEAYFDETDQPGRSVDFYARVTREFDRNRNIIDERYFDGQGKPFLVKGAYAEIKSRHDDHNALVEEAYFGAGGEPVANEKGWARHTRRYDEHNALVEEAWFGADGEPALNDEGWARLTNGNDPHGRALETAWFGIDGKPLMLKQGYAERTRRYDDDGQVVEEAYFGTGGEPVVSEDGYARIAKVYDALGRLVGWAHFGVQGENVIGTKERYHRAKVVLDERGNRLEFAAFGPDDNPTQLEEGYSREVKRYDVHDHLVEVAYFGVNEEPVVRSGGYSGATQAFDSRGKPIEVAYFGIHGKPLVGKKGFAKFTSRYNDYGDLIEEAYFGTDGEPVVSEAGYAWLTRVNDRDGRVIEEAYFGIDGKPVKQKKGFAKVTHRYDAQGGLVEDAYFGPGGEPVFNDEGYSRKIYVKDLHGQDIETAYFGPGGEPVLNDRGFARAKIVFDDLGREVEWSHFGVRGEKVIGKNSYHYHRVTQKLDARGNPIEFTTFGPDGKPMEIFNSLTGYRCAKFVRRFNANNKVIDEKCFDAAGKPVPRPGVPPSGEETVGAPDG